MISVRSNPSPAAVPPWEDGWITSYEKLLPYWNSFSLSHQHSMLPISMSTVNQFDAARLDIEMSAMLKDQLVKVFSLMKVFLRLCRRCCCCFSLFLTRQLLKVFFTLSRRTNLQVLQRMNLLVPFAEQVQHLLISLSLFSTGRYCYYCLITRCDAAPSFLCFRCSEPFVAMQQNGSVVDHLTQSQLTCIGKRQEKNGG